jgi:hypothetical protein
MWRNLAAAHHRTQNIEHLGDLLELRRTDVWTVREPKVENPPLAEEVLIRELVACRSSREMHAGSGFSSEHRSDR